MFSLKRKQGGSLYDKGVYPDDFTEEFKKSIRERDGNRCAVCGHKKKTREMELDVHHINFRKNTRRDNCISLCRDCHTVLHEHHGYGWRDWWRVHLGCIASHREKQIKLSIEKKKLIIHNMREVMRQER